MADLTEEHFQTLHDYHLLRDTFQQYGLAALDLFSSMKEFYARIDAKGEVDLGSIFKHLSYLKNRLAAMHDLTERLVQRQGVSRAIHVI